MDPATALLIAAAAGGVTQTGMGLFSMFSGQDEAEKLQKQNQDFIWQTMYRGPEIQRLGLERAGYNPMLALGTKPIDPGSTAQSVQYPDLDSMRGVTGGFSTAKEAMMLKQTIRNMEESQNLMKAQQGVGQATVAEKTANADLAKQLLEKTKWETLSAQAQSQIDQARTYEAERTGEVYEGPMGEWLKYVEAISQALGLRGGDVMRRPRPINKSFHFNRR